MQIMRVCTETLRILYKLNTGFKMYVFFQNIYLLNKYTILLKLQRFNLEQVKNNIHPLSVRWKHWNPHLYPHLLMTSVSNTSGWFLNLEFYYVTTIRKKTIALIRYTAVACPKRGEHNMRLENALLYQYYHKWLRGSWYDRVSFYVVRDRSRFIKSLIKIWGPKYICGSHIAKICCFFVMKISIKNVECMKMRFFNSMSEICASN